MIHTSIKADTALRDATGIEIIATTPQLKARAALVARERVLRGKTGVSAMRQRAKDAVEAIFGNKPAT